VDRKKHIFFFICLCFILLAIKALCFNKVLFAEELEPIIFVQEPIYDFGQVSEGTKVTHDFIIKNKGTKVLEINKVETG